MAKEQQADVHLQTFFQKTTLSLVRHPVKDTVVICDAATGTLRPYVPLDRRRLLFDELHNLAHPSPRASLKLVAQRFVWPGMNNEVQAWAKNCLRCQGAKIARHTKTPLGSIPTTERFHTIHIDLVGPLPSSNGHTYLVTIIDRFCRWPEVIPVKAMSTTTVVNALIHGWISRFGIPRILISDRGSQFESQLWDNCMQQFRHRP